MSVQLTVACFTAAFCATIFTENLGKKVKNDDRRIDSTPCIDKTALPRCCLFTVLFDISHALNRTPPFRHVYPNPTSPRLVALVSNGGSMSDGPPGSGNANSSSNTNGGGSVNDNNSSVLASRLNSKFRCLSCDRPLPVLGPPGPPNLGSSGLSIAGAGAPRSPQKTKTQPGQQRLRLTAGVVGDDAFSRPSSPAVKSPTSEDVVGDSDLVAGWGGGSSSSAMTPGGTADNDSSGGGAYYSKDKDVGGRRRQHQHQHQHHQHHHPRGGEPSGGRLEPIGANGEQMAGVLSRYPRMMPPPSRVRTAAGGGIGSRPGSSSGGRM